MGWTHALDVAHFFESLVCEALDINKDLLLNDSQPRRCISEGVPLVYVDNFIYVSESQNLANQAFDKVKKACEYYGLPTHDEHRGVQRMKAFGWDLDGIGRRVQPTNKRG